MKISSYLSATKGEQVMPRSFRVSFVFFLFAIFLLTGCPSSPSKSDGGTTPDKVISEKTPEALPPEKPISTICPSGSYCIYTSEGKVRSCSLLLEGDITKDLTSVRFGETVQGRSKQVLKQVGLSFIWTKNESATFQTILVSLKPAKDDEKKKITWKIVKTSCYDAKGQPIAKPGISIKGK